MKNIYKLLFPIILIIALTAINILESFFAARINWIDYHGENYLFLNLCTVVSIMLLSYYICFAFFNKKKKLFLYLIGINFLSIIPLLLTEKFQLFDILRSSTIGIQVSLIGVVMYLLYDWYEKKEQAKVLRRQNLQSELALLKSQINPHFLFNTLNNIDSLIKSNPDKASHMLVGLSDTMRYMIYETDVEKVPLSKELEYINNSIELQMLQFSNPSLVNYSLKGDYDNIFVSPMLFIPFIENAFKHCTNKEKNDAIRISFDLTNKNKLQFSAINIADKSIAISKDQSSGIGLETVKRRLQLLYPNTHSLDIKDENGLFSVFLSIDI